MARESNEIIIPNLVLGEQQNIAIEQITKWYKVPFKDNPIFYLAGWAGTGKSTIVPFVMQSLGINANNTAFMAYTGKAARVLHKKSGFAVSTIHSAVYTLEDDYLDDKTNQVEMVFRFNRNSAVKQAKLIVLDEVSMVSKELMEDLMKYKVKILVLGDPFQLPPVSGDAFFHEGYIPNYFLTDIHRQALENPVIALSMQVREGKDIQFGNYGDKVVKLRHRDAEPELWLNADQVIVGTNKTRVDTNAWFREELGYANYDEYFPVKGDRLICLRNYHKKGLVNGHMMLATDDSSPSGDKSSYRISFIEDEDTDNPITFTDEYCCGAVIRNKKSTLPYFQQKKLLQVDYSYAVTCHKFQGSQAKDILFYDEGFGRWLNDNTYYRHLYTGMTRTTDTVKIVA